MRGIHSVVDDLRNSVFKEVAKLAYEGGDYSRIDRLPYKIVPGSEARYRGNIFLERAIVTERLRLACGLPLRKADEYGPASDGIEEANIPEKYYEPPLINIIPFACNGCPPGDKGLLQLPGLPVPPLPGRVPQGRHLHQGRQEQH